MSNDPKEASVSPQLKRSLGTWDLMVLGVSVAVGTGIFTMGAKAASGLAGPAVTISFILASAVCSLAMLCYAEFASAIPVTGSAYIYTYVTMGKFLAWIVGCSLILEMFAASCVISKYWGTYLGTFLLSLGGHLPTIRLAGRNIDVAAVFIVLVFTCLLIFGTKLSTRVGSVFTILKVTIVLLVAVFGLAYFNIGNLTPFVPQAKPGAGATDQSLLEAITGGAPSHFGFFGIVGGASLVFFAFVGFDVVVTSAEETKNPRKTLPKAIFGGLGIVTLLYLLVSVALVGMVPYNLLAHGEPSNSSIQSLSTSNPKVYEYLDGLAPERLADIQGQLPSLTKGFLIVGAPAWVVALISIGIVIGLTTVLMVHLYGLSRVILAMSRDGLFPQRLSRISPTYHTPLFLQIICGTAVAVVVLLLDVGFLDELVNIGTLTAFTVISIAIIFLRKKNLRPPGGFKLPLYPWIPIISATACFYLMLNLSATTWINYCLWILLSLIVYVGYSRKNSIGPLEALKLTTKSE